MRTCADRNAIAVPVQTSAYHFWESRQLTIREPCQRALAQIDLRSSNNRREARFPPGGRLATSSETLFSPCRCCGRDRRSQSPGGRDRHAHSGKSGGDLWQAALELRGQ